MFEDREPEWKVPFEEQEALLIKERPGKPNPKAVDKSDPNRRKSIVLDDIATCNIENALNKKEKPPATEESEDAPLKKPMATFDIEHKGRVPAKGGLAFKLYRIMGLESLLPYDDV